MRVPPSPALERNFLARLFTEKWLLKLPLGSFPSSESCRIYGGDPKNEEGPKELLGAFEAALYSFLARAGSKGVLVGLVILALLARPLAGAAAEAVSVSVVLSCLVHFIYHAVLSATESRHRLTRTWL